jgi:hypothetical protein
MTQPIIVTAFSSNEYYIKCAEKFKKMFHRNCNNLLIMEQFNDCGDWHSNTRKKPSIILKNLCEQKQTIMWIDVDAEIYNPIELDVPNDIDMMAVRQEWGPRRTWCVGTILFNYTQNSIDFLTEWCNVCNSNKGTDEANLEIVWQKNWKNKLKTQLLPRKFFMVNKLHEKQKDTVILHYSSGNARKKEKI